MNAAGWISNEALARLLRDVEREQQPCGVLRLWRWLVRRGWL